MRIFNEFLFDDFLKIALVNLSTKIFEKLADLKIFLGLTKSR